MRTGITQTKILMIKITLLFLFGLIALVTNAAGPADMAGQWKAEIDTQIGPQKYLFTFSVEGGKLTGKAAAEVNDRKREADLQETRLEGETLTFVEVVNIQDNDVRIQYTGKVGTNEIAFTRQVGDFATEEFKATRVGPPALTNSPAAGLPPEPRAAFGRLIVLGPDDK